MVKYANVLTACCTRAVLTKVTQCILSPHSRKQDFRELKQLQREEMKEATEFYAKIKVDREIQEKKCDGEKLVSGGYL